MYEGRVSQARCGSSRGTSIFKEALKIFNYLSSADHALRGRANVIACFNGDYARLCGPRQVAIATWTHSLRQSTAVELPMKI